MIKFFRKIRLRLLSDLSAGNAGNKLGKYTAYAIGEIFLVVIGILIAIQLNTIKNDNDKKDEEITHLENILSDLKQEQAALKTIIALSLIHISEPTRPY